MSPLLQRGIPWSWRPSASCSSIRFAVPGRVQMCWLGLRRSFWHRLLPTSRRRGSVRFVPAALPRKVP
eukprot:symbB.v1.2.033695.t1/scaffold4218.1/size80730/2